MNRDRKRRELDDQCVQERWMEEWNDMLLGKDT